MANVSLRSPLLLFYPLYLVPEFLTPSAMLPPPSGCVHCCIIEFEYLPNTFVNGDRPPDHIPEMPSSVRDIDPGKILIP